MKKQILVIMVMIALVLSACTPAATVAPTAAPVEPTAVPATAVPATEAPTAAPTAAPVTLTVFAAASLTSPFNDMKAAFEAANPGVTVEFNFAGSQQLEEQLAQGAAADVFASASKKYMDAAVDANLVTKDTQKNFAQNRLVVIYPTANPGGMTAIKDLAKKGMKVVLAAKEVPVGQYALTVLDNAVKDPAYGATFKDDVLANVVSYEDNVKAVLSKVALGEADAGIVYVSDVTGDDAAKVSKLDIPDAINTIAKYPIAVLSGSKNPDQAAAFMAYVLSDAGQATLAKYSFLPSGPAAAPATGATTGGFDVTDAKGRTIHFDKAPTKIVVTGKALFMVADALYTFPEASERITAIGSTAQMKGKDFIPLIDANLSKKTILAGDAGPEQIAAVQPDCVVLKSSMAEKMGDPLEALKIPVVYVDFETPDQYARDLTTLGALFQNEARAKEVAAFFQSKDEAVTKAVSGLKDDQKPRTLVIYYSDKDGTITFNVPPMSWIQTLMVQHAGGTPIWQDANPGNGWTKVSVEQIATWDPEYVFVVAYFNPVNDVVATLKADPQWQALSAVKNNKIYGFATDVYSWDEADARWILGETWLAGKLHPDLFKGLDMQAESLDFYQTLYGMDKAAYEKDIVPMQTGDIK